METNKAKPQCPNCQSEDLKYGSMNIDTNFNYGHGGSWLLSKYPLDAFACLNCGLVGQYLSQKMRASFLKREGGKQ